MRAALGALVVALFAIGCGPARETAPTTGVSASDVTLAPSQVTTEIVGATPKQETILREILAGLGQTALETVHVVPAGEWAPSDPTAVSLRIDYTKTADSHRTEWEADLLGEVFARRAKAANLQAVAAYETATGGSAVSPVAEPNRKPLSAEELKVSVTDAASKSGAELVGFELLRPASLAFAVTLRTDTPAQFLEHRLRRFLEAVPDPARAQLDGRYVRVVDGKGRGVWSWGVRPYGGSQWTRQDLEGCNPVVPLSAPMGSSPLSCPTVEPAGSKENTDDVQIETVAPSDVTTRIVGGTPEQRAVLHEILVGIGPTRIESVELSTDIDKEWLAPEGAVGIDVTTAKPDGYSSFQASLVSFAFGGLSLDLGLPPVAYVGDNGDQAGGLEFSTDSSKAPWTSARAEEALERVAAIAKSYDASTRVRVLKPRRLAFAVEFRAEKPAEFLLKGLKRALELIEDPTESRHDGVHVKVVDAKGRRVLETGGGVWVRPDLLGCSPYGRFGSPRDPPIPPCPAK